jgi:hypothetical protein
MRTKTRSEKPYMAVLAILCWFALILQLYLVISHKVPPGMHLLGRIIRYFSFFTILSNLLVGISLGFLLLDPEAPLSGFFSRPLVQTAIALYISLVGLIYSTLLREVWDPKGLQKVADKLLHDIVPVLYVLYWLIFTPKGLLHWKDVLRWLIFPLAYLAYILLRGALSGIYPYPFLDVSLGGYARVFVNIGLLLLTFIGIGLFIVLVDRLMGRSSKGSLQG